jgi:antirestriction protein ArdC
MNVYEIITCRILESLTKGVVPWRCPWSVDAPRNLVSGRDYRGVNVLLLQSAGYSSPHWLTFNQARDLGGCVKRGEKGCPVIFWKVRERESATNTAEKGFILRYFTVFNIAQTDGIAIPEATERTALDPIAECDRIIATYPNAPSIAHGGGRAFYSPASDAIQVPTREHFHSSAEYYSTLFHELTHSTGASHRLNRKGVVDPIRFASHDYAFEELVAECGAAFLAAQAGISSATIGNSAAYIASWTKKLRGEPRWIVDAAGQASRAADFVLGRAAKPRNERSDAAA